MRFQYENLLSAAWVSAKWLLNTNLAPNILGSVFKGMQIPPSANDKFNVIDFNYFG